MLAWWTLKPLVDVGAVQETYFTCAEDCQVLRDDFEVFSAFSSSLLVGYSLNAIVNLVFAGDGGQLVVADVANICRCLPSDTRSMTQRSIKVWAGAKAWDLVTMMHLTHPKVVKLNPRALQPQVFFCRTGPTAWPMLPLKASSFGWSWFMRPIVLARNVPFSDSWSRSLMIWNG